MKKNTFGAYKGLYKKIISCFITAILSAVFYWFWLTKFNVLMERDFISKGNYLILLLYALIVILLFRAFNAYSIGYYKISSVILSQILALICTDVIASLQVVLMIGRVAALGIIFGEIIKMLLLEMTVCILMTLFLNKVYFFLFPPYHMLEVYGDHKNTVCKKIGTRADKYLIDGNIHISMSLETIKERILKYDAVLLNDIPSKLKNEILKFCFKNGIRVYFTPKISDILVKGAEEVNVFDFPLFLSKNSGLSFESKFIKRTIDIIASVILIIITSPVMLATTICIKLEDRGRVIYSQERCTLNGEIFRIYKFRSMIEDAEKEGGVQLAKKNDSRITKVGAFIRSTRIDELPQLFNILNGSMSLVGPRPERPEFIKETIRRIPEFEYRMKMKAGLTGYAQVYGKYNTGFLDKLKLDLLYIEKYSILLDLKIILMTIKVVFTKESTEGIEDSNLYNKEG